MPIDLRKSLALVLTAIAVIVVALGLNVLVVLCTLGRSINCLQVHLASRNLGPATASHGDSSGSGGGGDGSGGRGSLGGSHHGRKSPLHLAGRTIGGEAGEAPLGGEDGVRGGDRAGVGRGRRRTVASGDALGRIPGVVLVVGVQKVGGEVGSAVGQRGVGGSVILQLRPTDTRQLVVVLLVIAVVSLVETWRDIFRGEGVVVLAGVGTSDLSTCFLVNKIVERAAEREIEERGAYIEIIIELDGLGKVDAVAAATDIRVSLALGVAELAEQLDLVAVAAGELRSRSLGVLAASEIVGLVSALSLEILFALVVRELVGALPLLVDAAQDPEGGGVY